MAILREFRVVCGDFPEDAASFRNCASEVFYEHPWGSQTHTLAIPFLPASIGALFNLDRVTDPDQFIDQAPMQAFALGCQPPSFARELSPGLLVPLAIVPTQALLALMFDTAPLIVVLRVSGSSLPIQLALQTPPLPRIQMHFLGQRQQTRQALPGHDR
ncbi:MAG TPA: hypothetical protein VGM01_03805 [Ktedonobacteraceae bacterium]